MSDNIIKVDFRGGDTPPPPQQNQPAEINDVIAEIRARTYEDAYAIMGNKVFTDEHNRNQLLVRAEQIRAVRKI